MYRQAGQKATSQAVHADRKVDIILYMQESRQTIRQTGRKAYRADI